MTRYYRAKSYRTEVRLCPGSVPWKPPFPVECGISPPGFKMPLPQSDAEFEILTTIFFGKVLHLELWIHGDTGRATITEKYDSYGDCHYDKAGWFMRTIFGPMHCSASLGTTDFQRYKHRHWCRLQRWLESRRKGDSRTVRPAFVRLAHQFGVGENIVGRVDRRNDGVLIEGREDATSAA